MRAIFNTGSSLSAIVQHMRHVSINNFIVYPSVFPANVKTIVAVTRLIYTKFITFYNESISEDRIFRHVFVFLPRSNRLLSSSLLSLRPFFYLISVPENSKIQKSQFRNPNSLDSSLEQCKCDDTFSTIEISSRLIEYRDYIAYSFRKFRRFEEELSKLDTTAISLYYTLLNCVRS